MGASSRARLPLPQGGVHAEDAHSPAERRRSACGQALYMHHHFRGTDALPDGAVIILEEAVEDAPGALGRLPDIYEADKFGRLYNHVTLLLRNEVPGAEHRRIEDFSADTFPSELYVVRALGNIAPETVEPREFRIFETRHIYPLIEFEHGLDALSHHYGSLAQG